MTREEAIAKLAEWFDSESGWNVPVQAVAVAYDALRGPQPNPATGLKGCLFCKAMDDYKALQIDPPFAYEYTAAIVSRLYKVGNPRSRSTSTNYGHGKFALNYCPMCGRKLEVEG